MFKKKIISISAYIIAILFLIFYLSLELSPNIDISEFGRLFLLCGSCLFLMKKHMKCNFLSFH